MDQESRWYSMFKRLDQNKNHPTPTASGLKVKETSSSTTRLEDWRLEDTRLEDTRLEDTRLEDSRLEDTRLEESGVAACSARQLSSSFCSTPPFKKELEQRTITTNFYEKCDDRVTMYI